MGNLSKTIKKDETAAGLFEPQSFSRKSIQTGQNGLKYQICCLLSNNIKSYFLAHACLPASFNMFATRFQKVARRNATKMLKDFNLPTASWEQAAQIRAKWRSLIRKGADQYEEKSVCEAERKRKELAKPQLWPFTSLPTVQACLYLCIFTIRHPHLQAGLSSSWASNACTFA